MAPHQEAPSPLQPPPPPPQKSGHSWVSLSLGGDRFAGVGSRERLLSSSARQLHRHHPRLKHNKRRLLRTPAPPSRPGAAPTLAATAPPLKTLSSLLPLIRGLKCLDLGSGVGGGLFASFPFSLVINSK